VDAALAGKITRAVDAMRSSACACVAIAAMLLASHPASAAGEDELISLINSRRAETRGCDGGREAAVGPLAPSPVLAQVDAVAASRDLRKALTAAGYRAAMATTIVLSGVASASEAARIVETHCEVLRNRRYAEIGVGRDGSAWRINLAAPLLAGDLGDWREAGKAVLRLVNDARKRGGTCGKQRFAPALPLAWNDRLGAAALAHSRDMAAHDYFDHVDRSGGAVAQRAGREGYPWRVIGENIAAGLGSPRQVVTGWLASPGHCANILSPDFAEMSAAYAINDEAAMEIYWTQVFGRR